MTDIADGSLPCERGSVWSSKAWSRGPTRHSEVGFYRLEWRRQQKANKKCLVRNTTFKHETSECFKTHASIMWSEIVMLEYLYIQEIHILLSE